MTDRLESFLKHLEETAPPFFSQIAGARARNRELFDDIGGFALELAEIQLGSGYLDRLIKGYCTFVLDVNKSQIEYEELGRYRYSLFREVFAEAYGDPDFMSLYHWGVFVTTFGWEHHLKIAEMYVKDFLPLVAANVFPSLLDLGCGSGIWHFLAHRRIEMKSTGVDISETSIETTTKSAAKLALTGKADYLKADAVTFKAPDLFDAGVSCFLLEHLEEPVELLRTLCGSLKENAYAFTTCALTAAEIDHIYEIKHEHEIARMAHIAGFRLVKMFSASPVPFPWDRRYLPRSVAMILQKRHNEIW